MALVLKIKTQRQQCKRHSEDSIVSNPRNRLCAHLLSYYPELLSCAVLVDTPWIFNATFALLKNILSPRTLRKVSFVKSDSFAVDYVSWYNCFSQRVDNSL